MALTNQQKSDLLAAYRASPALQALVTSAGMAEVVDGMRELYAVERQQSAIATLSGNVVVTVSDWPALESYLASGLAAPAAVEIAKRIGTAIAARNATPLGPGFAALYGAIKQHWNL